MKKKIKTWLDSIKFKLMERWTKGRGLAIVSIVTVNGTDYIGTQIADAHGNKVYREIGKDDLILMQANQGAENGTTNAAANDTRPKLPAIDLPGV